MYVAPARDDDVRWADVLNQELFKRIGPILKLQLRYDRAGRSEGTAFVTYELKEDAQEAIRQFDGANANGTHLYALLWMAKHQSNEFQVNLSD